MMSEQAEASKKRKAQDGWCIHQYCRDVETCPHCDADEAEAELRQMTRQRDEALAELEHLRQAESEDSLALQAELHYSEQKRHDSIEVYSGLLSEARRQREAARAIARECYAQALKHNKWWTAIEKRAPWLREEKA